MDALWELVSVAATILSIFAEHELAAFAGAISGPPTFSAFATIGCLCWPMTVMTIASHQRRSHSVSKETGAAQKPANINAAAIPHRLRALASSILRPTTRHMQQRTAVISRQLVASW